MKKHDRIFLALVGLCSLILILTITENIRASLKTATAEQSTAQIISETTEDRDRSEAIRKKFKALGLDLHDGKYWTTQP